MDLYNYGSVSTNMSASKRRRLTITPSSAGEIDLEAIALPEGLEEQLFSSFRMPTDDKICAKDNHIYFYAPLNDRTSFRLNMVLKDTIREMQEMGLRFGIDPPVIKLHISSPGGVVFGGLSIVDTIKSSPVEIHSIVEGSAASAATFISIVCKKRYIRKHAFMLIHQLSTGVWGKADEVLDEAENVKRITEVVEDIYASHSDMSRPSIRKLKKHDLWMKPLECMERGLVDEILE